MHIIEKVSGHGNTEMALEIANNIKGIVLTPFKRSVEATIGYNAKWKLRTYPGIHSVVDVSNMYGVKGHHVPIVIDDADAVLDKLIQKTDKVELLKYLLYKNGLSPAQIHTMIFVEPDKYN